MQAELQKSLERFEDDMNWSGMEPEDLLEITLYTIGKLNDYLANQDPLPRTEIATLGAAIELIQTHEAAIEKGGELSDYSPGLKSGASIPPSGKAR